MSTRTTIYLSEPLEEEKQRVDRGAQGFGFASRLTNVLCRYQAIVREHKPALSEAEWNACRDALNGLWTADNVSPGHLALEIADADRLNGLGAKWDIDGKALARRVNEMSYAEAIALAEAVERWWLDRKDDPCATG